MILSPNKTVYLDDGVTEIDQPGPFEEKSQRLMNLLDQLDQALNDLSARIELVLVPDVANVPVPENTVKESEMTSEVIRSLIVLGDRVRRTIDRVERLSIRVVL